ncbi:hypothetical protein [Tautonia marina]|uniref:hypothetical protein n=1 Tax=Tautonia marina TaxID=2653855 RepID=UPI001260CB6A|nr:hypothetical protein [Tautonia marina]
MKTHRLADPPVSDRTFKAAGLFARLADAMDRSDLAAAADAQKELARLGYVVRIGAESIVQPRLQPYAPADEADGRGVR